MKRPAWQHYPKDWRNNAKLRLCSWGARGVWLEVLGLMHDNETEYGVLRATLREIANAVGCPPQFVSELARKDAMKGSDKRLDHPYVYTPSHAGKRGAPIVLVPAQDGPIWFSSRMVRDEYLRKVRGKDTRFGQPDPSPDSAPKPPPKASPKTPIGGGSGYGAAFAVAVALDIPEVGVTSEASGPSPPGDTRLNGKSAPIPRAWRLSEAGIKAAGDAVGLSAYNGESWDAFRDRIAQAIGEHQRSH